MTNFDKEIIEEWGKAFAAAVVAFVLLLLMCLMCGCRTQYVPVETVRTEYKEADTTAIYNRLLSLFESRRENTSRVDSLVDRIKETVVLNEQGDTTRHVKIEHIYLSSYKEKEYERIIEKQRDSIGILNTRLESVKADSIQVPYPVEKQLSKWEQTKMSIGGLTVGVVIAFVIGAVIVWLIKKFRK